MAGNPLKAANDAGIVKGLGEFGSVSRQDVDELLFREPECFNLFLIALKQLQDSDGKSDEFTPWTDKMSYFQIAGIHGLPNTFWDNEKGKRAMPRGGNQSGYCSHGTQTFPTWHRPYLVMLEQSIYKKMLDIVEKYNEPRKSVYKQAVKKFRLPYWDYLRARDYNAQFPGVRLNDGTTVFPYDFRVPQILTIPKIQVNMYPNDTPTPIENPLSRFKFPKASTNFFSPQDWSATYFPEGAEERLRTFRENYRGDSSVVQQLSDLDSLNAIMNIVREGSVRMSLNYVEDGIYDSYIDFASIGVFGGNPTADPNKPSGSLENIHNNYHGYIGGGGHMSAVTTAAFDPIFWLHHCNIDRYFAIWQGANPKDVKNPKTWFATPAEARLKNVPEAQITPDDPLLPFRRPEGKFWTSNQVYKTDDLGYTYSDTKGLTPQQVRAQYKSRYEWARRLTTKDPNIPKPPPGYEPLNLDTSPFFKQGSGFVPGYKRLNMPQSVALSQTFQTLAVSEVAALKPSVFSLSVASQPQAFAVATGAVEIQAPISLAVAAEAVEMQAPISSAPDVQIPEEKVSREWYVDDQVQRLALNGAFSILYLIGEFDRSLPLVQLRLSPTFVGHNHIFSAPVEACDNCGLQDQQASLVTGTTPITSKLLDYVLTGRLASMRPEHVKPFLVENLKWRVVGPDGERVDPRGLAESKDFKISVSCKIAPLPGQQGQVVYEVYSDISHLIIANAS